MSTARISVKVNEEVKQGAQRVLHEIGMDLTTAIDTFLRTVVREECIPFELRTGRAHQVSEAAHNEYIRAKLEEAIIEANDPNTKWLTHEEVMANMEARIKARKEAQKNVV